VYIEHLDADKLVQNGTRGQAEGQRTEPGAQGHVQAVGHEGDKNMRLDPALESRKMERSAKSSFLKAASIFD
jgi:hypothetical protein